MARKREKTETGRIYCDFFAEHLILDNFSRVNVVKMLNPSQKIMKVPMQNTPPPRYLNFFALPLKNCRDQRKLTIITPRNSFQATPQKTSFTGGCGY